MTTMQLNRNQMSKLKVLYLMEVMKADFSASWLSTVLADMLVGDQEVHEHYRGIDVENAVTAFGG